MSDQNIECKHTTMKIDRRVAVSDSKVYCADCGLVIGSFVVANHLIAPSREYFKLAIKLLNTSPFKDTSYTPDTENMGERL